ncbi:hypothetical protein ACPV51_24585, partial [Vibrio astriarenae]
MSQALGLQAEFLTDLVEAELTLFKQIDTLHKSLESMKDGGLEKDEQHIIKKNVVDLDATIREALSSKYGISYDENLDVRNAKTKVIQYLCSRYS